jgi:hypothetical protein
LWPCKGRRHPIKRDASGLSARESAFRLFTEGKRPAQVAKVLPISSRTACRYFEDFKKQHHNVPYSSIRKWMKESPEFSDRVIAVLANSLDMSTEEVVIRMQHSWGLLRAMKGEWPDYRLERQQTEIEDRLLAALEIVNFADRVGSTNPQLVRKTLRELMTGRGEKIDT